MIDHAMKAFGDYLFEAMAGPNQSHCSVEAIAFSWICIWIMFGISFLVLRDDWKKNPW